MFPKTTACAPVLLLTFLATAAGAQDLPAWESGAGAAAETPVEPPPSAPDVAGEPAPVACFPSCRRGYLCVSGQCVSACNPACGADEICTAEGECLSRQPAAAPAAQAAPAAAPASVTNVIVTP